MANTGGYSENRSQEWCHEENAANARPIAAAPDLYEAAKAFINHRRRVFDAQLHGTVKDIPKAAIDEIIDTMEVALAKAEGDTP